MSVLRECLVVVFVTSAMLLLLFRHVLTDPFYYFAADVSELYFPWWVYLSQSLRSDQFPILNPYWFAGSMPFATLETGVFYPLYLVIQLLFDASTNLNLAYWVFFGTVMFHYLIASISMYVLCRIGLRLHRAAAIFGGLVYATSGGFIGEFVHPLNIMTFSWLPFLYACFFVLMRRKRLFDALLCTLILFLIITVGHPQYVVYILLFFGVLVGYRILINPRRDRKTLFWLSGFIAVVTTFLSAPKLLLSLELSGQIVRVASETTIKNLYNSLHPAYFLTLLAPYLFGKHQIGYWGSQYPWGNWENFLYIGILPVFLLPFSFRWKNRKLLWFFLLNGGLAIILMFGKYNALSAWLNQSLPFSSQFSLVSRMSNHFHFFLSIIAAIGLHVVIADMNTRKKHALIAITTIVILGGILLSLSPQVTDILAFPDRTRPTASALQFIGERLRSARVIFLISAVGLSVLIFTKKKRLSIITIFLVYIIDLTFSAGGFHPIETSPGSPNQYFGDHELTQTIKRDTGIYRVNNLWPRNFNMIAGIESMYGYHTIETKSYRHAMSLFNFNNRALLDLLNVKYFISDENLSVYPSFSLIIPTLWENKSVLPRLFFVPSYRTLESEPEMIQTLTSSSFNPRQEVLLYADQTPSTVEKQPETSVLSTSSTVDIVRYRPTEVVAHVNTDSSGFLVFSQFQYPGWAAIIDGVRTPLVPANSFFYAAPVPDGLHEVTMMYRSRPLVVGVPIAGITGGILLLTFFIPSTRRFYLVPLGKSKDSGSIEAKS